jgi:hypothetical protein
VDWGGASREKWRPKQGSRKLVLAAGMGENGVYLAFAQEKT